MRYCSEAELEALWARCGIADVGTAALGFDVEYASFEDYWDPFTLGVGPGGAYCASLGPEQRERLRLRCFERLGAPTGPFTLAVRAVAVRGLRPG
jgi:hypothetical protein